MTTKGKRKSATFCLTASLFALSLFAQATECFRLKKTERRDKQGEEAADFQPGRILFGNVFEKRSSVGAQAGDGVHVSPASADDDASIQGDSPDWYLQTQIPPEMRLMDPSVLCGLDRMKFVLQGADEQQFAMDPGPAGLPVPLSYIHPSCGYNVQKHDPSLVMMAPYNDCFMIQEGAYYVLPMRWQDTQFSLWCPKQPVSQMLSPPQVPPYFLPPWFYPGVPPLAQKPHIHHGHHPHTPEKHPGHGPQSPHKPGHHPHAPEKHVGHEPQSQKPGHHPHVPEKHVGHHRQSPQKHHGHEPQSQIVSFPKFSPWNPYLFTAPSAKVPLNVPPQQMFQPFYYPASPPFYPPSWGGLVYPPVEYPVKTKHLPHMPGVHYPHNFPQIWNPFPHPHAKQHPPKVYPNFPPIGQLPIKEFKYPAA